MGGVIVIVVFGMQASESKLLVLGKFAGFLFGGLVGVRHF